MFGLNSTSYGGAVNESRHKIQVRTTDGYHQISVDNQITGSHSVSSDALTGNTMPIYLWARNNSGTVVNYTTMRLFRARIVIDNTPYEFIPCKNSSNVVGLYDIEHGQFYTKTGGTGAFVAGPESLDTDEFLIRSDLNEIAFSGSYNDLSNTPNISNATIIIF